MKKKELLKVDGLGPKDAKRLVTAIRRVWAWSHARKLCIERATLARQHLEDPLFRCEKCKAKVPKIYPDHIKPVGAFDEGYIGRMFVPSVKLQALCKKCHQAKTNLERAKMRKSQSGLGF